MSFINILKALIHSMLQLFGFAKKTITNKLNIYVKTSTGSTLSVNLDPQWDIKNVKEIIAPQLGLKPEEVKIIFAGKELEDTITIAECDLGQQSIIHAVKTKTKSKLNLQSKIESTLLEESLENSPKRNESPHIDSPLSSDVQERDALKADGQLKVHFYVFCSTCKSIRPGKLRVRCHFCKSGAFTVHSDPQNWSDVLESKKITGSCENDENLCGKILNNAEPTFAQFYFKCAGHVSQGETDQAVALNLIKPNVHNIPCLACASENCEPVLVFPCPDSHVICIDCFRIYCTSRLNERQFREHDTLGYTLGCPIGCPDSFIKETHHFRVLSEAKYMQYQRFATEEYVLQEGGVFCPQPNCGMGILIDPECTTVTCVNGCGFVFCRRCLNGNHIGECMPSEQNDSDSDNFNIEPTRALGARWDEASRFTIKVSTKPCPKCQTPTERDGGCMHMICTRAGCEFHWCWVCQTEWTRDCMGSHWFG